MASGQVPNIPPGSSVPQPSPPLTLTSAAALTKLNTEQQEVLACFSPNVNNVSESKPVKNKMPTQQQQSTSQGLFSGLGVKNPISAFGATVSAQIGKTIGNLSSNNGLPPPIPRPSVLNNNSNLVQPTKPLRASLAVGSKSRLKSPSRKQQSVTLDDYPSVGSGGSGSMSAKSRKKVIGGKRYASSLPDHERNNACSPVAFDINSFLCHNQGPIDFSALLGRNPFYPPPQHQYHQTAPQVTRPQPSFRAAGGSKPTKHCKNKHLWARTSLDRDFMTQSPSPDNTSGAKNNINSNRNGATSPINNANNRHSSYHPSYGNVGDNSSTAATAAAAAAAAAYNAHMFFSRPTSPLFLDSAAAATAAAYCSGGGDFGSFCHTCAVKTFPRAHTSRTNSHHGLCTCCHQQNSGGVSSSNLLGVSLAFCLDFG